MKVYEHKSAIRPAETKEGSIELPSRPMIGEEIEVGRNWEKIEAIRHSPEGMTLVLKDKYLKP